MIDYLPVRSDLLVLALGTLLYLVDTGRLISRNELLLVGSAGERFRAVTPASGFLFNRRYAVFPGLIRPAALMVRLRWPATAAKQDAGALQDRVAGLAARLAVPRVVCRLLLAEIFLGIPLAYFLAGNDWPLLLVFVVVYLQIIGLSAWLLARRKALALTIRQALVLVFESVVCLPYAINFHQKVFEQSLHPHRADPLDASAALLADADVIRLKAYLRASLSSHPASGESSALADWRTRIGSES